MSSSVFVSSLWCPASSRGKRFSQTAYIIIYGTSHHSLWGHLSISPQSLQQHHLKDVEYLMWVNALAFTFSSALNSAEVQSFSLDLVFGLYLAFLQNMQWPPSIPDETPCPASLLVLFPETVALKSFSGDPAFFLSVNLALHNRWYLTIYRGNPPSSTRIFTCNSHWRTWVKL